MIVAVLFVISKSRLAYRLQQVQGGNVEPQVEGNVEQG